MVKVICVKCGSMGYTASPEQVNCPDCGGRHRTIRIDNKDLRLVKPTRKE